MENISNYYIEAYLSRQAYNDYQAPTYGDNGEITNIDTITFLGEIEVSDIMLTRDKDFANDLIIKYSSADSIRVKNWYSNLNSKIEKMSFNSDLSADFDICGLAEMLVIVDNNNSNAISGTNSDDEIEGTDENDVIDGKAGDDNLNGGAGDDTYLFSKGDGVDTITDTGGNDTLQLEDFYMKYDSAFLSHNDGDLSVKFHSSDDEIILGNSEEISIENIVSDHAPEEIINIADLF